MGVVRHAEGNAHERPGHRAAKNLSDSARISSSCGNIVILAGVHTPVVYRQLCSAQTPALCSVTKDVEQVLKDRLGQALDTGIRHLHVIGSRRAGRSRIAVQDSKQDLPVFLERRTNLFGR